MQNSCVCRIILLINFISHLYSAVDVIELRNRYLNGDLTVEKIIVENLFDYPYNVISNLTLFEIYLSKNEEEKFLPLSVKLSSYYPVNQIVNYKLGVYYLNKKEYNTAKKFFYECIKNDSRFSEARMFLGKICKILNNYKEAYRHYNLLSWLDTKNKEILKELEDITNYIEPTFQEKLKILKKFSEISSSVPEEKYQSIPTIDVGISVKDNGRKLNIYSVIFRSKNDFLIFNDKGEKILSFKGGITNFCSVVYRKDIGKFAIISSDLHKDYKISSKYLIIKSTFPGNTFIIDEYRKYKKKFSHHKEYPGEIVIKNVSGNIVVINRVKLDEYLYNVVAKEIGKDKPIEALKTQSVVARTLALYRKKEKVHKYFDLCCGQHCQVYDGVWLENDNVVESVNSTLGEVIFYNGRLVHTFFHANCGGITTIPEEVGWGNREYEYLKKVSDIKEKRYDVQKNIYLWLLFPGEIFCKDSVYVHPGTSRWCRVVSRKELSKRINQFLKIGELKKIKILSRNSSGYVTKLKLIGSKKEVVIEKEHKVRRILTFGGLRSSKFYIEYNKNTDEYYFWGAGWGHGVGMCQYGVCGLAEQGENYINIIHHYYPGTEVMKIY